MRFLALVLALAACGSKPVPDAPKQPDTPKQVVPDAPPASNAADSIGEATMLDDGTIRLQLIARGEGGMVGDALLTYPPSHAQYQYILDHLGPMKPGDSKAVPPFPDK
jgi:predicted small lipoprotein YifL